MYTRDQRQFFFKVEVKWDILSWYYFELSRLFQDKIKSQLKVPATTSIKVFRTSSSAKFVIKFDRFMKNPDAVDSRLESLVSETVQEMTDKYHQTRKKLYIKKLYA